MVSFSFQRMEARMSQLVAAQEAYKKARNEWAAQVLQSVPLFGSPHTFNETTLNTFIAGPLKLAVSRWMRGWEVGFQMELGMCRPCYYDA